MASVSWPSQVNYLLDRGTFSLEENTQLIRSEFDDGPTLVRQRFNRPITIYSGSIGMTNKEFSLFRSFYMASLAQGTRWFDMPIWDGTQYSTFTVRFKEDYQVRDEGWDQYTVSIKLEIRNFVSLSEFAIYLLSLYPEDFILNGLCDPIDKVVNVDYPNITVVSYPYISYFSSFLVNSYSSDFADRSMADPIQTKVNSSYKTVTSNYGGS